MLGARARWSAPRSVGMIGVEEVGDEAGGAQVAGDGRHPGRKPVIGRPGLDRLGLVASAMAGRPLTVQLAGAAPRYTDRQGLHVARVAHRLAPLDLPAL